MIRHDVYICPFLGFTDQKTQKTGCLLHHDGSPHEQVKMMTSPQHFSFYGENICKTYNCISKQRFNSTPESFHGILEELLTKNITSLTYSKFICNHNLVAVVQKLTGIFPALSKSLLIQILHTLEETEIPVTSFEMPLTLEFFTDEQLWDVLGMLFLYDGYCFESFKITETGIKAGKKIKAKVGVL